MLSRVCNHTIFYYPLAVLYAFCVIELTCTLFFAIWTVHFWTRILKKWVHQYSASDTFDVCKCVCVRVCVRACMRVCVCVHMTLRTMMGCTSISGVPSPSVSKEHSRVSDVLPSSAANGSAH